MIESVQKMFFHKRNVSSEHVLRLGEPKKWKWETGRQESRQIPW